MKKSAKNTAETAKKQDEIRKNARASFERLLRDYESEEINRETKKTADANEREYTNALYQLARACTLSVIKKCMDKTESENKRKALENMKNSVARAENELATKDECRNAAYENYINRDGDSRERIADIDAKNRYDEINGDTLDDGFALVQDAICFILEESRKARERGELKAGYMEKPYTFRKPRYSVYTNINAGIEWIDKEVEPIRMVYREIRRSIESYQSLKINAANEYTYISELTNDPESDETDEVYRRLKKCADLNGRAVTEGELYINLPGETPSEVPSEYEVSIVQKITKNSGLTPRQEEVLSLLYSGLNISEIARKFAVSRQAIQEVVQRIRKILGKSGISTFQV